MKYLLRVLGLPFFLGLMVIWLVSVIAVRTYDWLKYGGEAVSYNDRINRVTITQVFYELQKQQKEV